MQLGLKKNRIQPKKAIFENHGIIRIENPLVKLESILLSSLE